MQDLARAAEMSAGNFYRYFPSKNAIVEAIIERELDVVRGEFSKVIEADDPLAAFRGMVRHRIETPDDCEGQIWVEMEAAAARRPEIAALFGRMEAEITRALVAVFARIRGAASGRDGAALFGARPAHRHAGAGRLEPLCDARRRRGAAARPTISPHLSCGSSSTSSPKSPRRTAPGRPNRICS